MLLVRFFLTLCLMNSNALAAVEETRLPKWEIGLAAGLISIPHYVGSDQRYTLPLGLPFLVYRGDIIKADREGVRGELFFDERLSIDLGFSFGLPVKNGNDARDGMPDINLTGQAGPRINWKFDTPSHIPEITLLLPVRYVLDIRGNGLDWVVEPSLMLEKKRMGPDKKSSVRMDLGLLYASNEYNEYYYGVSEQFATADRPAYNAKSGLHSYFINLSTSYKQSAHLSYGAFIRLRNLSPSVISDSPLVKEKYDLTAGVGLVWSIWQSKTFAKGL